MLIILCLSRIVSSLPLTASYLPRWSHLFHSFQVIAFRNALKTDCPQPTTYFVAHAHSPSFHFPTPPSMYLHSIVYGYRWSLCLSECHSSRSMSPDHTPTPVWPHSSHHHSLHQILGSHHSKENQTTIRLGREYHTWMDRSIELSHSNWILDCQILSDSTGAEFAPIMSAPSSSTSTLPSNNTVQSCSSMNVGSPQIHSFSFEFMETLLHAQIWFMRSSILLWIGDQSATMHSLTLAIKSSMDSTPSVSCLLGHGHALGSGANPTGMANGGSENEDQVGNGMAARIGRETRALRQKNSIWLKSEG